MRWKAFFLLHNRNTNSNDKEPHGFKLNLNAHHHTLASVLDEFEENMLNTIQRVEFKTNCAATDSLQAKLDKDVQEIRLHKNIYVKADKTTNHYTRLNLKTI